MFTQEKKIWHSKNLDVVSELKSAWLPIYVITVFQRRVKHDKIKQFKLHKLTDCYIKDIHFSTYMTPLGVC